MGVTTLGQTRLLKKSDKSHLIEEWGITLRRCMYYQINALHIL